jgi:flavin reductase (DIM6/NTAB) family NADH-FMN oxidoreductase RutF
MSGAAFRTLMGSFPTGVAVVTALDPAGQPHGMTCTSLTSVTVEPPTLLVCLDVRSGTLAAVVSGGWFAVNLLRDGARSTAELFAGPVPHRFRHVGSRPSPTAGVPWLAETVAAAECRVSRTVTAGDHEVVFGEVVAVACTGGSPLLYGRRQFSAWPGPVPEPVPAPVCQRERW